MIKLKSIGDNIHYLKKLKNITNNKSIDYLVYTNAPIVKMGYTSDKKKFIELSGGPILTEGELVEELNMIITSINLIAGYGYILTFGEKSV